MSSAAGPMVPVRTGSWLLRPLAPSLSSNAVSVFPFMSTATIPCGGRRALRARRTTRQVYMDPSAESRRAGLRADRGPAAPLRSEEHTSELQSRVDLVCRLLLEKKKNNKRAHARSDA